MALNVRIVRPDCHLSHRACPRAPDRDGQGARLRDREEVPGANAGGRQRGVTKRQDRVVAGMGVSGRSAIRDEGLVEVRGNEAKTFHADVAAVRQAGAREK